MTREQPIFEAVRVRVSGEVPPIDPRVVDVAVLDMNHTYPNLGHDALVKAIGEIALDLHPLLEDVRLSIRVVSYDVRAGLVVPEEPGERFGLYVGTGGPGHLDPRQNDGIADWSQGIREDPAWERPVFRLLDAIHSAETAALVGVCHTFGVLCRWAGVARPVLRGAEKGGKSSGVRENILTAAALRHPWFSRLLEQLPDGRRLSVLDSRLFDLVPPSALLPAGMTALGFEATYPGGPSGDAVTMIEFAPDGGGTMPRIFAVNHHPEVRDRTMQRVLLDRKLARGEVTVAWYEERRRTLAEAFSSAETEALILATSYFTLLGPLRFHLYRQVRLRLAALGCREHLHEDMVLRSLPVIADPDSGFPL
jgi:hypothetical protein